MEIEDSILYKKLEERKSDYINNVKKVYAEVKEQLPKINNVFANYTNHGIKHSLNVMKYMADLCNDINSLSDLEMVVMIYSALLHDIGMVVTKEEIEEIKNGSKLLEKRSYSAIFNKYNDENTSLQEYIRPIHGERTKQYIKKNMNKEYFLVSNYTQISFQEELGIICQAHNEDFEWIISNLDVETKRGNDEVNFQYIAMLLRIADYLDIDEERAPMYLYKLTAPTGYGDMEWRQHFIIANREKIVYDDKLGIKHIELHGTCDNPSVYRKFLHYFRLVSEELRNAVNYSKKQFSDKYLIKLDTNIDNRIKTKDFEISDLKFSIDYQAIVKILMGKNIYGNNKYGLRELIQNSIDTCKVMEEESQNCDEFKYEPYKPLISIILDKDSNKVLICDNGKGMSFNILKKYFLSIGKSYYTSDEYLFKGDKYIPIGNYGIGFLACFMLSKNVVVETKMFKEKKGFSVELESDSEYITFKELDNISHGTKIKLDYSSFSECFKNEKEIKEFITENFLDCGIPIKIIKSGTTKNNVIRLKKIKDKNKNQLILDKYLKGIQAAFIIEDLNSNGFVKEYKSIIPNYKDYIYDESNKRLVNYDEKSNINIEEYVEDDELYFYKLNVIKKEKEELYFDRIKIGGRLASTFDLIEPIIFPIKKTKELKNRFERKKGAFSYSICTSWKEFKDTEKLGPNMEIMQGYSFEQFCKDTGNSMRIPVEIEICVVKVMPSRNEKYLEYDEESYMKSNIKEYINKKNIFVRNVLVSKASLSIPYLLMEIDVKDYMINILDKKVIPNISRTDIDYCIKKEVSYAIGKAIHLWILDNISLSAEDKDAIRNFIKKYYSADNDFINKNNLSL